MSFRETELTIRDRVFRADEFRKEYGIDVSIYGKMYNDEKWNFDKVTLNFLSNGKKFELIEHYNEGDDNSTKFVELIYRNNDDELITNVYSRFVDAERDMARIMKEYTER